MFSDNRNKEGGMQEGFVWVWDEKYCHDSDGFRFSAVGNLLWSSHWNFLRTWVYVGFHVTHTRCV